jgi:hypothetical protein
MTDFALELRHRCRNPRCRSKLPKPVENEREAFCTRGCHSSFYRKRCLICERGMERTNERQLICGKRRCRNALQGTLNLGRHLENPIKPGIKTAHRRDRALPFRVVAAGAPISANQYHCATVPDGPDCQWRDGEYERLEARNSALLSKAG